LFSQETLTRTLLSEKTLEISVFKRVESVLALLHNLSVSKKVALILVLFSLIAANIIVIQPIKAGSTTIIVPDDYPTIMAAIGNATDSDTIFVKSGIYNEQELVINKTLSLIGENANGTKILLHPPLVPHYFWGEVYSDSIKINANDVVLSGFTIATEGGKLSVTGNGTRIIGNIVDMVIAVTGHGNLIIDNDVPNITLRGFNQTIAQNTIVSGAESSSLWIEDAVDTLIAKNDISGGCVGMELRSSTRNQIVANNIVNAICVQIDDYFGTIDIQTRLSDNNTFYQNNFISNSTSIDQAGYHTGDYSVNNVWDNGKNGNYWSDYDGTDANVDGIGDAPYIIDSNNQDHYPLMTPVDVSIVTVRLPEITLPKPSPLPSASSSLSPTSSHSEKPTHSSQLPSEAPQIDLIYAAVASAVTVTIITATAVELKKRRKNNTD